MGRDCVLRLRIVAALAAALLLAGCPSSAPTNPSARPSSDGDAAKALEAAGALLTKDASGQVTAVELNRDNGKNDDLKHVMGLPSVRILTAECRGVTDEGLKLLEGHPN